MSGVCVYYYCHEYCMTDIGLNLSKGCVCVWLEYHNILFYFTWIFAQVCRPAFIFLFSAVTFIGAIEFETE